MGGARGARAGLLSLELSNSLVDAENQLYQLLQQDKSDANSRDAYSCYNALLRELVSFELAQDHRLLKQKVES